MKINGIEIQYWARETTSMSHAPHKKKRKIHNKFLKIKIKNCPPPALLMLWIAVWNNEHIWEIWRLDEIAVTRVPPWRRWRWRQCDPISIRFLVEPKIIKSYNCSIHKIKETRQQETRNTPLDKKGKTDEIEERERERETLFNISPTDRWTTFLLPSARCLTTTGV